MLKFGNKEFRNLQEQVEENMKDIEKLKTGQAVLDEFGIKVVGEVSDIEDLPTVAEYKESTPDWEYGDAYAVGSTSPYTLYILTRANGTHEEDYWFDIGEFPAVGPQGPQGPQGPEGQQGQTGDTGPAGADAGFGTPTATASMTARGSAPTVNVTASGPNTEKVFNFDFYLPVATPKVTITSASGTLTLAEYNILFNFEDSVVVFKPSSSLANNAYTLQRWYSSDDYIVFICLYNYTPYKTGVYRCRVDRSNRSYLIYADEAIKINKWNISTAINSTTNETAGKVLTADGNGGASWETAGGGSGVETVTLTTTVGNLSDADYAKVAGNACVIVYDDNTTKVYFKKYDESSTTITYATPYSEGSSTYQYGVVITKATKYYEVGSAYMPISNSNIKSGSTIADKYLKTNGSGGAVWGDAPSQVQSDWNESSQSSPAFIKNKPTIPTVPVTDVTVNGTSVMDGTTAKVLVDTVDGATDGTNWTSLTINGTTAAIPQGSAQVQADWTETDTSDPSYIQNKPTIPTVDYPVTDVEVNGTSVVSNKVASITVPTNYVTTDTNQTITGSKAFISGIVLQTNTTDNIAAAIARYNDGLRITANELGSISFETVNSNGIYTGKVKFDLDNASGNNNVSPNWRTSDIDYDLGTSSNKWNNLYLKGNLSNGTNSLSIADINTAIGSIPTKVSDLNNDAGYTTNTGTVTSVAMTLPTGLTVSGSPITSSGTLAVSLASGYKIPTEAELLDKATYKGNVGAQTSSDFDSNNTSWSAFENKTISNTNEGDMYYARSNHAWTQSFSSGTTLQMYYNVKMGDLLIAYYWEDNVGGSTTNMSWHIIPGLQHTYYSNNSTTGKLESISISNIQSNSDTHYLLPSNTSDLTNDSGFITGITSSDVTTALGYTPLNSTACTYQTTEPTAAISDGGVHIVYLSAEPSTKYSGYIYMIAEA